MKESNTQKLFHLTIFDTEGRQIKQLMHERPIIEINSENLQHGTYYWKAQLEDAEIASGKFIVV